MRTHVTFAVASLAFGLAVIGCSKDESKGGAASASAAPSASAPPVPASGSAAASAAPPASARPVMPSPNCPKGSTGPGTFDNPCLATGASRMMDVAWTKKTDDKGPYFRVTNKSPKTILYGKIAVYFYDKSGKQLDEKDSNGKTHPYETCSGNIFSGVMKPGEKAVLTFSCVKKESIPEGTATIEGEMEQVGFADESGKRNELYWRNTDLVPEARKKGGVK
jgi:hypothetical protein